MIPRAHAAEIIIYKYVHLDDHAFPVKDLYKIKHSRYSTHHSNEKFH